MKTLGVWLRQAREAKGSTLGEAAESTHIRPRFLEALEEGDFAVFQGGDVQIRGFLRIYARYLDLSPDEVLSRYDAEVHGVGAEAPKAPPREAQPARSAEPSARSAAPRSPETPVPPSLPRRVNPVMVMIVGVLLVAIAAVAVALVYFAGRDAEESVAAGVTPVSSEVGALTATATPTPPPAIPTATPDLQQGVTLTLEATEHVWVRVTEDGQKAYTGLMVPGQVESWSGEKSVTVHTGNGAGLLMTVDGQAQGAMCGRGEVCTRAWGPAGELAVPPGTGS